MLKYQKTIITKKIKISISSANKKDDLQNNKNNTPNRFFLNFGNQGIVLKKE